MAKKRKTAEPAIKIHFQVSPERYAEIVRKQRVWINGVADKLEQGKSLVGMEPELAAAILRAYASRMNEVQPRPRGQAPQIDHALVAFQYAGMLKDGVGKMKAIDELAARHHVSDTTIKSIVAKNGGVAMSMFGLKVS